MNRDRELARIIDLHQRWLASNRTSGQRLDLSGAKLDGSDFSGVDLSGAIFVGASLGKADFSSATLIHTDFTDAYLAGACFNSANLILADFTRAELQQAALTDTIAAAAGTDSMRRGPCFRDADLSGANLQQCYCYISDFSRAKLSGVNLSGAMLERARLVDNDLSSIQFTRANLLRADLQGSDLSRVDFVGADLTHANLERTTLSAANIKGAQLQAASLADARVDGIRYDGTTRFKGIRVAECYGSARFRRFAQDQDFIEEFREAHPTYYRLWLWLSDCGRSLLRVGIWCLAFTLSFAAAYYSLGEGAFAVLNEETLPWTIYTALYYSIANFTSFGQGDITPRTPIAAVLVISEVLLGYIMLGILISILATKVARRS